MTGTPAQPDPNSFVLDERPMRPCDRCGLYDTEARVINLRQDGDRIISEMTHPDPRCLDGNIDTSEGQLAVVVAATKGVDGEERANAVLDAARSNLEN